MHAVGDDLRPFIEAEVDFDFVSTSLSQLGLKRGHFMGQKIFPSDHQSCSITHEVVVDLENFRTKEKLMDKFTARWVRTLTGNTDPEKDLKKVIKLMMESYKSLVRNQTSDDTCMLSTFLATPFNVQQQAAQSVRVKPTLKDTRSGQNNRASKEKSRLQEQISTLQTQIDNLTQTVHELSEDKKVLQEEVAESRKQKTNFIKLQKVVTEQRQLLSDMKPEKL